MHEIKRQKNVYLLSLTGEDTGLPHCISRSSFINFLFMPKYSAMTILMYLFIICHVTVIVVKLNVNEYRLMSYVIFKRLDVSVLLSSYISILYSHGLTHQTK